MSGPRDRRGAARRRLSAGMQSFAPGWALGRSGRLRDSGMTAVTKFTYLVAAVTTITAGPALAAKAPSVRGELDGDRQPERVSSAPVEERGARLIKLRIADRCGRTRIVRTVSGKHEAVTLLKLVAADIRRGRELLFQMHDGAARRAGEARLVAWRRTGRTRRCRAPRVLLRYSTRRPTRLPPGAHQLSAFELSAKQLTDRFAGREVLLVERFARLGDDACCPSIARRTSYRYDRGRDRYVRYGTTVVRRPRPAPAPLPAGPAPAPMPLGPAPAPMPGGPSPVIAAAGDIACDPADPDYHDGNGTSLACRHKHTSDLLVGTGLSGVLTLGDNQYEDAQLTKFQRSYGPTWGRAKAITYPSAGNHEYLDPAGGAKGYFDYFGAAAGERGKGYYSFDLGSWHLLALNSNCSSVGGCGAGSPQEEWLRRDLATTRAACVLAYWHHPRFSSGQNGDTAEVEPLWRALHDAGADLVLAGHDHTYERFAPQDPMGRADPVGGIRQFVVGTGGRSHYGFPTVKPNSEVRSASAFGVLKLTLQPLSYQWRFEPAAGQSFEDAGTGNCH